MKTILYTIIALCFFACAKTKNIEENQQCKEVIHPDCICTMQYEPVCGCNGKTYSNPCVASCSGIKEYKKGECL